MGTVDVGGGAFGVGTGGDLAPVPDSLKHKENRQEPVPSNHTNSHDLLLLLVRRGRITTCAKNAQHTGAASANELRGF